MSAKAPETRSAMLVEVPGAPVVGHVLQLLRDPLGFIGKVHQQGDIALIRLGRRPVYVINAPALVTRVLLQDAGLYAPGRQYEKAMPTVGAGLGTSYGEAQRRERKRLQPHLRQSHVGRYTEDLYQVARKRTGTWRDGQTVDVNAAFRTITLENLNRTLFGEKFTAADAQEFSETFPVVMGGLLPRALLPGWAARLPLPPNRRYDTAAARMDATVHRLISAARSGGDDDGTLLSALVGHRDPLTRQPLSDKEIRDYVMALIWGGSESVATTMSWAVHLLGRHQDVQARLCQEVDGVLDAGQADDRRVQQLGYVRRVIDETLRMYPPFYLNSKRVVADTELGGVPLPAGAMVLLPYHALHNNPLLFADPDRFDPDRWLPTCPRPVKGSYLPFSEGGRRCIGEHYGIHEIAVVLAVIAERWTVHPAPGSSVVLRPGVSLFPDRLRMIVRRRHTEQ